MKALDFLKDVRNDTSCEWIELDEAINELEELHNRSCDGCIHHLADYGNFPTFCYCCSRFNEDLYTKKEE